MASPEPLWRVLRDSMARQTPAMSVRRLAKLLHSCSDSQSEDSWRRTLYKYLDQDAEDPVVPSQETARLLAQLLGEADDFFVRPQVRETLREENQRLREELADALAERDRLRQSQRDNAV